MPSVAERRLNPLPVRLIQPSLRDGVPPTHPVRGLKPTATIASSLRDEEAMRNAAERRLKLPSARQLIETA
jgi:hypothetical protein